MPLVFYSVTFPLCFVLVQTISILSTRLSFLKGEGYCYNKKNPFTISIWLRKFLASWILNYLNLQFHYSRRKFVWNFPPHCTWRTGMSNSSSSPFPCPSIQSSPALTKCTMSTSLVATIYTLQSTGIIKKTCKMPTSPVLQANANQRLQFYGILSKGKAIPVHAWTASEGSRRMGLPEFMTISTWRR